MSVMVHITVIIKTYNNNNNNRLERLSIDYTVSLEMAEWLMTGGLARLTGLSLGHARQRYSQHSSVARLTPSRWASLLARCHLPHLQRLEIPVLFQPEDTDPGSQVRCRADTL